MLSTGTTVRYVGLREAQLKLAAAGPRILEENRLMVTEMAEGVRAEITPGTPEGPGHFGVHLRDSYRVEVSSTGPQTSGKLWAAVQGYWREFGTRGRYKGRHDLRRAYLAAIGGFGGGGEKAGLYATKALNQMRRMIYQYYGRAQWWRL